MDDEHKCSSDNVPDDIPEVDGDIEETWLDKVPAWVIPLGAGCLFTATLITATMLVVVTYPFLTGEYPGPLRDLQQYSARLFLIELQLLAVTGALGAATYFAWRGTNWTFVLLACLYGSILVVTIPFTFPAFLLLLLGKRQRQSRLS